jgi:ABC-type Fe3+ transport system permease subunit
MKNGLPSLYYYSNIFNKTTLLLLLKSILIAFLTALFSTAIGGFFAFSLNKTDLFLRNIFRLLFLIPLFIPPYIIAVAWADFFILIGWGKSFIYSMFGVVFVLTLIFTPLAMIIISASLRNLSAQYEEAALMYAQYGMIIRKIVIPLLKPAIISSFILIFVLSISEFSVPAFLSVNVLITEIFTQFSAFYNYGIAVADSMALIGITVSLLLVERFYLAEIPFISVTTRTHRKMIIELRKTKYPLFLLHLINLLLVVFIPLIVLVFQSFHSGTSYFTEALALLSDNILNSILLSFFGALLLLLFGFIFAYIAEREKIGSLNLVLLITFGIPSTVLGIGLIQFFNTPLLNFIYSSSFIVIIGYLGRFIFISEKLISNAVKQIPLSFEESAMLMGGNFLYRVRKILFPLISEGLFAAFIIGFIFSLGEIGTTILIYPPGTSVLPIKVFTVMANAPQSLGSAMSLIVLLITLTALLLLFIGQRILFKNNGV